MDVVVVVAIRTMVDNDNKTQVRLNLEKCNISQLCMMLMLVYTQFCMCWQALANLA